MANGSHILNFSASPLVRDCWADKGRRTAYGSHMARRGIPTGPVLWYLREWMAAQGVLKQTDLMKLTGWSKAKMSALYNYEQDFNSRTLEDAARALEVAPFELLMHPDDAFALRRLRKDAIQIVQDVRNDVWRRPPPADHVPVRKIR